LVCIIEAMKCVIWAAWGLGAWLLLATAPTAKASKKHPQPLSHLSSSELALLTMRLSIPAALYALQNNLVQFAYFRVNSLSFTVLLQLKILTTALSARLFLRKPLSRRKWLALLLLTIGVVLVQLPPESVRRAALAAGTHSLWDELIGSGALLGAAVTSGFASIYLEALNKGLIFAKGTGKRGAGKKIEPPSIALQSFLLSVLCLLFASTVAVQDVRNGLLAVELQNGKQSSSWIPVALQGIHNPYIILQMTLQALAGIFVGLVIRYADNLLKGFATAVSFILTAVGAALMMQTFSKIEPSCWMGTVFVAASIALYAV
jgi:UDP-sugar transporter A1/2/3